MQIQVENRTGFCILSLSGQLNARHAAQFEQIFVTVLRPQQAVLLDCELLETLDSTGLGALIRCLKAAVAAQCPLLLTKVQRMPQMVLEITHTAQLFHMYDSLEAAIDSLPGAMRRLGEAA
jgi:anti-sigma B factor antagonist